MNKFLVLSLATLTASHVVANADSIKNATSSTQSAVSIKQQNIKKVLELTLDKDQIIQSINNVLSQFPQVPSPEIAAARDRMTAAFVADFTSGSTIESLSKIYDGIYTDKDVEELLKFYLSETGKKMIKSMPEIAMQSSAIAQSLMQKHLATFMAEATEIEKKGAATKNVGAKNIV